MQLVVEVPTLSLVTLRRSGQQSHKENVGSKLLAPKKLKIKKGPKAIPNFNLDTISKRLDVLGPPGVRDFHVPVDEAVKAVAPPRAFFSDVFGGNPQETFPTIGKKKAAEHNFRDFAFPHSHYNPVRSQAVIAVHGSKTTYNLLSLQALPFVAGAAGLIFSPHGLDQDYPETDSSHVSRLIVRLPDAALWLYVGQYQISKSTSLTQAEWLEQPSKVRSAWIRGILIKDWGRSIRTRIVLRNVLGKEPEEEEIEIAMQTDVAITEDEISMAYNLGEERLGVFLYKCVGYDEDFGRQIFERFSTWTPKAKEKKDGKKKSRKRKRGASVEDMLSDAASDLDMGAVVEQEDDGEAVDIHYVPGGTRSRPRA
ncbi:hypothetical protein HWV62_5353 [Athelia sp. TMB]|nr:hypothetical protein HWV62_5353 [Athelia sp. TMB]